MKDQLHELLSALPRERAGEAFETDVLREARRRKAARTRRYPLIAAAALAASLALVFGSHLQQERKERELRDLKAQQQAIQSELQRLKQESAAYQPVIYLGSSGEVDYVLDVREPAPREERQAQTVSYEY